jgi:hypothetical protein
VFGEEPRKQAGADRNYPSGEPKKMGKERRHGPKETSARGSDLSGGSAEFHNGGGPVAIRELEGSSASENLSPCREWRGRKRSGPKSCTLHRGGQMHQADANVDVKKVGADVGSYSSGVGARRLRCGARRPIASWRFRPVRPTAQNLRPITEARIFGKPAETGFPDNQFNLGP